MKTPAVSTLISLSLVVLCIAPCIGVSFIWPNSETLFGDGVDAQVWWSLRVPRVFLGFLVGAGLGMAGMVFQALFHNPLASPYTFGVASGASFGASCVLVVGGVTATWGIASGGVVGALVVTGIIYLVGSRLPSATHMLLSGVALSFFFSSFLLFVQYSSSFTESFQIVRWMMGGLTTTNFAVAFALVPFVVFGALLVLTKTQELDIISTGDELAYSRGVDVAQERKILFLAMSLVVGVVVSCAGPIGFVGIMIPHVCRLVVGSPHRFLAPCVIVVSGAFLVACDALARCILSPAELPVGIITALLGGPFFLWVLLKDVSRDG